MMKKIIKYLAVAFLIAVMVMNISIISTKNNNASISLKSTEARACENMEGIHGYVAFMEDCQCYDDNGNLVNGCQDSWSKTCTLP